MKKLIIIIAAFLACVSLGAQNNAESVAEQNRAAVQAAERQSREQNRASRREIDRSQDQIKRAKQQIDEAAQGRTQGREEGLFRPEEGLQVRRPSLQGAEGCPRQHGEGHRPHRVLYP